MTTIINKKNYVAFTLITKKQIWINRMMVVSVTETADEGSQIRTFDGNYHYVTEKVDEVLKKLD